MSKTLAVKVPDDWALLVEQHCERYGVTKSYVLKEAIAAYLNINPTPTATNSDDPINQKFDLILEKLAQLDSRVSDLETQEPVQAIAELMPSTPVNPPAPPVNRQVNPALKPSKPNKALSFVELCRFKGLDGGAIAVRAAQAGMTKEEALEFETGWRFTQSTRLFKPW